MKRHHLIRILVGLTLILAIKLHAEVEDPVAPAAPEVVQKAVPATPAAAETPVDKDSPVAAPPLDHYAKLWTHSLFTSHPLPPSETPKGPSFTDNFSLSGTSEQNGKLTAILVDKSTSTIVLAYIGEDNPEGFRIAKVDPGQGPMGMRLQLQKGSQFGWVSFASDLGAEPPAAAAPNGPLGTRNAVPSPVGKPFNRGAPGRNMPPVPQPAVAPQSIAPVPVPQPAFEPVPAPVNSLRGGMPQAAPVVPSDIPLPPN